MSPFSLPVSRLAPQPRTPLRQAPVRHIVPALVALAVSLTLGGCSEAPTSTIESSNETSIATAALAKGGAPKFWEQGSSVYWNRMGRELLATTPLAGNPAVQARVFTYLAIAQYNAVVAAENGAVKGDHPSGAAAAAAASVGVLKSLLPALSASIDTRLADQLASDPWPGEKNRDVAMGLAIGTQIAAAVVAYAATDNVGLTQAPPVPVGPGKWTSSNSITALYGARFLVANDTAGVMPPPPPAFGSMAYVSAMQELRTLVLNRTLAQVAIAQYWAPRAGASMNAVASELIVRFHRKEREAARIFALANIAGFDALNACFVSKFAHYYIRPTQVDPTIALIPGVGLPNHPSYPSGHSCITGAFTGVLAAEFPSERASLDAMMDEAGVSRMYAGFHFRFDVIAGQDMSRGIARAVMAAAPKPRTPIALD